MAQRPRQKKPSRAELRQRALTAAAAVDVPATCDVAVVGGGASGLAAAICAAEAGASVVVIERDLECGRKILATGNGRCNFANEQLEPERYRNGEFVAAVAGPRWLDEVLEFFAASGLAWASEEGRLYPLSRQAASVRNVLLARAARAKVTLAAARKVTNVARRTDGTWHVSWHSAAEGEKCAPTPGSLTAKAVVIASGGTSELARNLELSFVGEKPVLCALACRPVDDGHLDLAFVDGRRAHAHVRLLRDTHEVWAEDGEVLFRPWGLSGICIFDMSRRAEPGDVITLDLTCGMPDEVLAAAMAADTADGVIDPQVAIALGGSNAAETLERARDLRLEVTGPAETERAQVTRGGLDATGFLPKTLEAKGALGLFACGEALDVDADCGGFNLAWAWRSGQVAGCAAAARARGQEPTCTTDFKNEE